VPCRSPSPRTAHQSAVTELALLLGPLVRSADVGAVTCAPSDWVLDLERFFDEVLGPA